MPPTGCHINTLCGIIAQHINILSTRTPLQDLLPCLTHQLHLSYLLHNPTPLHTHILHAYLTPSHSDHNKSSSDACNQLLDTKTPTEANLPHYCINLTLKFFYLPFYCQHTLGPTHVQGTHCKHILCD